MASTSIPVNHFNAKHNLLTLCIQHKYKSLSSYCPSFKDELMARAVTSDGGGVE
jgi:hypothetical protein